MNISQENTKNFFTFVSIPEECKKASEIVVKKSLKIMEGEKVLIISNPIEDVAIIAYAMYNAVLEAGGKPVLSFQNVKMQMDFAEEIIISSFDSQPDVVISLSAEKMGKDQDGMENPYEWDDVFYEHIFHYQLYGAKTVRAFWSPSITRDIFSRTIDIDYDLLKNRCNKIIDILDKAVKVQITNPNGTNVEISIEGRKAKPDSGDFSKLGMGGNLPAGEVYISPVVGKTNGIIVFDGSISTHQGDIIIKTPIHCTVKDGYVTDIKGKEEASILNESIRLGETKPKILSDEGKLAPDRVEIYTKNARNIGELGIGLNPNAKISGNMLEDEKAFNTCHFALGSNYDNDAPALIHLDGLVTNPTIIAIMENGKEIIIQKDGLLIE